MNKVYDRINWENYPSEGTPINEDNLNRMDNAIDVIDRRVVDLDNNKQNNLNFDSTPTQNSTNPVTSGGVYSAIQSLKTEATTTQSGMMSATDKAKLDRISSQANKTEVEQTKTSGTKIATLTIDGIPTDLYTDDTRSGISVSGNPITITDAEELPAEELKVNIEPVQDLHGYDKPWIGGAGKNLLPMTVEGIKSANTSGSWSGNSYTVRGITFDILTDIDGNVTGINANGTSTAECNFYITKNLQNYIQANTEYKINGCPQNGSLSTYRFGNAYANYDYGEGTNKTWSESELSNNIWSIIFIMGDVTVNNLVFHPMICLATETDATFEPYTNICPISGWNSVDISLKDGDRVSQREYSIALGQTVYGGVLDVTKGELRVERGYITIDDSTTVETANEYNHFVRVNNIKNSPTSYYYNNLISDKFIRLGSQLTADKLYVETNNNVLMFRTIKSYDTLQDFKDDFLPIHVVYELATHLTIQLTPQQIELLENYNILSADAGAIDLTYQPNNSIGDVKRYIEDKLAEQLGYKQPQDAVIMDGVAEFETVEESLLNELTCNIESVQDLHGYDFPWIGGAGKNLLPMVIEEIKSNNSIGLWTNNSYNVNDVTLTLLTVNNNILGIRYSGTPTTSDMQMIIAPNFNLPEGNYILNGAVDNDLRIRISDKISGSDILVGHSGINPLNFTSGSENSYRVSLRISNKLNTYIEGIFLPMIRSDVYIDSTFNPYTNICPISGWDNIDANLKDSDNVTKRTFTVSLNQTVYGGTLNVTKGFLTIENTSVDLGSLTWTYSHTNHQFYSEDLPNTSNDWNYNVICECYRQNSDSYTNMPQPHIRGIHDYSIYIIDEQFANDVTSFENAMSGMMCVYPLATPITVHLTPQEILALEGINKLSVDCGDVVSCVYSKLASKIAASQVLLSDGKSVEDVIENRTTKVYGFHINGNESNHSDMVTYIADSVGMQPAYMDYTNNAFNYGSWGDVWFVRDSKPCILGQDGVVQAYLDKNDYTKDIDGDAVTIDSTLANANVMIEFPKIWYKVVPDSNSDKSGSIYISPVKIDEDYKDYAYIDHNGVHKEHFYMPAYNGSNINNVLRSISGASVSKSLNATTEIAYAKANGDGWFTEDAGENMLINFLLILMAKSTDTQTAYGRGIDTGGETAFNNYVTGAGNTKGFFWGSNDGAQLVKVFGIENWWGLQWRRYAGDILDNGVRKIKLCYGNEDGSTTFDFNTTGEGYVDVGVTPSGTSGGYISQMKFGFDGMYSAVSSGSSSTYYTDGQWFNNSDVRYALHGGDSDNGLRCGAFCVALGYTPVAAGWYRGAAPSYK